MKTSDTGRRASRLMAAVAGVVLPAVAFLPALTVASAPGDADAARGVARSWSQAEAGYRWEFPRDHWARHGYRIEWWYFTGHLDSLDSPEGEPARRFGYQFTLFRIGVSPEKPPLDSDWSAANLVMGHASVTEKTEGRHRFAEVLFRESPLLAGFGEYPDPVLAWSRAPAGSDGRWAVSWNGEAFDVEMVDVSRGMAFALETRPSKARIFQGPGGLSRKSDAPGAASLYYSYTRLETTGTVTLDGRTFRVRGESWMDKEFSSSQLTENQVGWDWFSIQLDDGRELMLYELRDGDGRVDHGRGTLVPDEGGTRFLTQRDWTLVPTETWRSPRGGTEYPAGWTIEVPSESLRLRVEPEVADQENRSELPGGPTYWEGAVRVLDTGGAVIGKGYVELTGYGENNRPPV